MNVYKAMKRALETEPDLYERVSLFAEHYGGKLEVERRRGDGEYGSFRVWKGSEGIAFYFNGFSTDEQPDLPEIDEKSVNLPVFMYTSSNLDSGNSLSISKKNKSVKKYRVVSNTRKRNNIFHEEHFFCVVYDRTIAEG